MRRVRFHLLASLLFASAALADSHAAAEPSSGPTAQQSYRQLLDGHARYVNDVRTRPHQDENRRSETTTGGQHPIAAVLSCADSRVPPEMLFDQGLGDLFVIRVAGNVAATDELGTLEYGVEHLNIPLIVVLGHSRCGAVTAVVNGAHTEGNLAELLKPIVPAAERAKHDHPTFRGTPLVNAAIQENVRQAMSDLTTRSPLIAKAVAAKRVEIVGGVYDIYSGRIDWLDSTSLAAAPARADPAPAHDGHADHAHHAVAAPAAHHVDSHAAPAAAVPPAQHGHVAASHDDGHAAAAEPEAESAHGVADKPKTAAKPKAKLATTAPAEAQASSAFSLADNGYLLIGMMVASTLVGAGITRLVPQAKA